MSATHVCTAPSTCPSSHACLLAASLSALLWPGAGKTTLLNLLGSRLPAAHSASPPTSSAPPSGYRVSGSIRCNGLSVSSAFFSCVCAYVPQQSILLSSLTPRESILFASKLRLPSDTSAEAHERNADRVLTSLSLHSCAHTRAGDELTGRGLSGGEQRRTNVGVELVTRPPLVCLDEPTTGLDNETALRILETLRALTRPADRSKQDNDWEQPGGAQHEGEEPSRGCTVVCSIHQPSAEAFALLDHLVLLAQGRIVYCGPAAAALGFFARLGHPCPPLENPPEYYLDVCAQGSEVVSRLDAAHREYFEKHYRALHDGAGAEKQTIMQRKLRALVCEPEESARDSTPEPAASASLHNRKFSPAVLQQLASPGSALIAPPASDPFSRNIAPHAEAGAEEARMLVPPKHAQHDHLQPPQPQRKLRRFPAASPAAMDRINEEGHDAEKGGDGELDPAASIQLISSRPESFRARVHHAATQLRYLTLRAHLNASRLPLLKGAQILQTIVLGLLIGLAFLNLGSDQLAVQDRLGSVYFIVLCVLFANTLTVVLNFAPERAVFLREQGNNMYPVASYFIARTSIDIIPTFLCSLGMCLICFWMIGRKQSSTMREGEIAQTRNRFAYRCSVSVLLDGQTRAHPLRRSVVFCYWWCSSLTRVKASVWWLHAALLRASWHSSPLRWRLHHSSCLHHTLSTCIAFQSTCASCKSVRRSGSVGSTGTELAHGSAVFVV